MKIAHPERTHSRRRPASGFTLIEALVTIVVLSFGVLALAALQLRTLVDGRTASMRNVATVLAYNLADQLRSNEAAMTAGAYNQPVGLTTVACFTTAGCTPAQMAASSYKAWLDDTAAALPSGLGTVCIDSTPDDGTPANPQCDNASGAPYAIKIWWQEDKVPTNQDPVYQRFVTAFVP
ncbi:type IV pilus modification protein PilV [Cupriavidus sp. PET2-C1]